MTVSFGANWPTLGLYVNFSGTTWTDVSAYIRAVETNRPNNRETGTYPAGSMSVTLDNRDGRFSPANTSGPYTSGGVTQVVSDIGVRLEATWSGTTYNLFVGTVEDWADEWPNMGYDAVTVLTAIDPSSQLAAWEGEVTFAQVSASTAINTILNAAGLGATKRSVMTADESVQAATLTGSALDMVQLVTDSEGGAMWYDPLRSIETNWGGLVWESRSALRVNSRSTTSQVTFGTTVPIMSISTSSGRDQLLRAAAYTRVDGVEQVTGTATDTPRKRRTGLLNVTDASVKVLTDLAVAVGSAANAYRVAEVTVQGIASPTNSWPHVLGRRIRDRVTVTVTPAAGFGTLTRNAFIAGIRHSISREHVWTTTFTLTSAAAMDAAPATATWDSGKWDTAVWWY